MAERSLRGMSIGAKSLESDDNVDFAARTDVAYVCPKGHRTILPFAEGAEFPDEWECRCGAVAHREGDNDALGHAHGTSYRRRTEGFAGEASANAS